MFTSRSNFNIKSETGNISGPSRDHTFRITEVEKPSRGSMVSPKPEADSPQIVVKVVDHNDDCQKSPLRSTIILLSWMKGVAEDFVPFVFSVDHTGSLHYPPDVPGMSLVSGIFNISLA